VIAQRREEFYDTKDAHHYRKLFRVSFFNEVYLTMPPFETASSKGGEASQHYLSTPLPCPTLSIEAWRTCSEASLSSQERTFWNMRRFAGYRSAKTNHSPVEQKGGEEEGGDDERN
jgi:hypothetical protein